jgi:flagellar biogenesis protein FliO
MEVVAALRVLAALIVIALVLLGLHFATRSIGRRGGVRGRLLRIVDTLFLPGAASLHVVAVADRYFVIGRSPAQVTLVAEISSPEASPLADRG